MTEDPTHIAEVIEGSTTGFVSEFRRDLERERSAPAFGSFLKTEGGEYTVLGITCNVSVRSVEPNRRPAAFGLTQDQLRREMPQVFELLRTEIDSLVVGYIGKPEGRIFQMLPHVTPKIHSFVHECSVEDIRCFVRELDFLRIILNSNLPVPREELIVSSIRFALNAMEGHAEKEGLKVRAGKELSRLIKNDYDLLRSIVKRISL